MGQVLGFVFLQVLIFFDAVDADARSLTALGNILLKFAASKHFLNILLLSTLAKSGCLKSTFRSC